MTMEDVLIGARNELYAGSIEDRETLAEAVELGYVRRVYEGAAGLLGVAVLELTGAGRIELARLIAHT